MDDRGYLRDFFAPELHAASYIITPLFGILREWCVHVRARSQEPEGEISIPPSGS